MSVIASSESSAHDFDFWTGTWRGHNRRLRERLAGCDEWDEFEGTCVARPLLDGLGNMDEFRTDYQGGLVGLSLRFFDFGDPPVVDLLDRQPAERTARAAGRRLVLGRHRRLRLRRHLRGPADHRALSVVRRDRRDGAVGPVVFGRRRRDLGDELDGGAQPRGLNNVAA